MEKKEFFIDMIFPKLRVEGEYDVNLMMFNIPIKSTGPVYINASEFSRKFVYASPYDIPTAYTLSNRSIYTTYANPRYVFFLYAKFAHLKIRRRRPFAEKSRLSSSTVLAVAYTLSVLARTVQRISDRNSSRQRGI